MGAETLLGVPLKAPSSDVGHQPQRQLPIVGQLDGALAGLVPLQPFGKLYDRVRAGVDADVALPCGEVDDVVPLPIGGHAPGDALLRLRDGLPDGGADRTKPRPDGRVLLVDVGVDAVHMYPPALLTNSPVSGWFQYISRGGKRQLCCISAIDKDDLLKDDKHISKPIIIVLTI